jgi:hypothetical protein
MFPNNLYIIEKLVQMRQEEVEREAAQNRLVRECNQNANGTKAGLGKYKLFVVLGVLSALMWFLR